jgi:hypothetical protein
MMMIKIDPWKSIDRDSVFDEPESVYVAIADLTFPTEDDDRFRPRLFTADKIKDVQVLQESHKKAGAVAKDKVV